MDNLSCGCALSTTKVRGLLLAQSSKNMENSVKVLSLSVRTRLKSGSIPLKSRLDYSENLVARRFDSVIFHSISIIRYLFSSFLGHWQKCQCLVLFDCAAGGGPRRKICQYVCCTNFTSTFCAIFSFQFSQNVLTSAVEVV